MNEFVLQCEYLVCSMCEVQEYSCCGCMVDHNICLYSNSNQITFWRLFV